MPRFGEALTSRRHISVYLICCVVLAMVTAAMGMNSVLFWLWNASPVLGGTLLCVLDPPPKRRPSEAMAFLLGAAGVTAAFHLAWLADHELRTGSSTSGLIFIFIPFFAVGAGTIAAILAFAFGHPV